MGNGDAGNLVVSVLDGGGGGFSACVTAGVGSGGGDCGCDIAIDETVVDTGDRDGLGCVPVGGCEGESV